MTEVIVCIGFSACFSCRGFQNPSSSSSPLSKVTEKVVRGVRKLKYLVTSFACNILTTLDYDLRSCIFLENCKIFDH